MSRLIGEAYISLLADGDLFRASAEAELKRSTAGLRGKIPLSADARDLDKKIAEIAAALKGLNGEAKIGFNTTGAIRDIATLDAAADALQERLASFVVDVNNAAGLRDLYAMIASANDLQAKLEDLDPDMDLDRMIAKFYAIEARADKFEERVSAFHGNLDAAPIIAKFSEMEGMVTKLAEQLVDLRMNADAKPLLAEIVAAQARVLRLAKELRNMPMTADTLPFEADLLKAMGMVEALQARMDHLQLAPEVVLAVPGGAHGSTSEYGSLSKIADTAGGMAAYGALAKIAGADENYFNKQLTDTGFIAGVAAAGLERIARSQSMIIRSGGGGWWAAMNTQIRFFGGALDRVLPSWARAIALWHLGADLIFEFAAAWAPAIIAVGTFAAYAYPVGEKIFGQWKNINTILDGVGGRLPDLGSQFDTIEKAIEPSILEAFGEYMQVIGHNAVPLGDALAKVGKVVDIWGAAMVSWSGKAMHGFDDIVNTGAKDFAILGDAFHQLFRIFGSLFHDMPGYVHILLAFGDIFLTVAANIIQFLGPVIKAGLYLHGFMVYAGLAVTAIVALGRAMSGAAIAGYMGILGRSTKEAGVAAEESKGKISAFAAGVGNAAGVLAGGAVKTYNYGKSLFSVADDAEKVGVKARIGGAGAKILGDALKIIPYGEIGLGVGLVAAVIGGALYFTLTHATNAAKQFNDSMQRLIANSSYTNIQQNLQTALTKTAAKMNEVTKVTGVAAQQLVRFGTEPESVAQQKTYVQGLQNIVGETQNYGSRLSQLTHIFGTTGAAQQALNLAGIKAGDIATENNGKWGQQLIELKGLAQGYGYMGQQAGAAGSQLNTLAIANGNTTKNIQALQQAETGWINMVTSGDQAFTTFEQGQNTLNTTLKGTGGSTQTLTVRLGNLRQTYSLVGAKMNGTKAAALAARQAFDQQVQSGATLYTNLQMLAAAGGHTTASQKELAKSGKDIIAQLLPMAGGSKEATAEVYALAQIVGYTGKDSFPAMVKWLGNTKGAEADLNSQQSKLTLGMANLSTAAKNLGNALNTEITSAQAAAIAKMAGLTQATNQLAKASGNAKSQISATAITAAGQYVSSLTKAGLSTSQAKEYLNAYLHQLGYSNSAIQEIDANLHDSKSQWDKYSGAVAINTRAANANAKATAANHAAYQALEGVLPGSITQLEKMWGAIQKQDTAMVNSGHDASAAKGQFVSFAEQGLGLSTKAADELWQKFGQNNLDYLATHAATTKAHFIDFAENGLHLSAEKAGALWSMFAQNNLDMLVAKGNNAKAKFIDLARNGLDLTASQANNLWNTMKNQYLDTLATKAGETKKAFEGTAGSLGLTKQKADDLYASMHTLASHSPYKANESTTFTGAGAITAHAVIPGQPALTSHINFLPHAAGGMLVPGGVHGRDSVPALLAPGELVIPSSHAATFADQAKRAGVPGLASGGLINGATGGGNRTGGGGIGGAVAGIVGSIANAASGAMGAVGSEIAATQNVIPWATGMGTDFAKEVSQSFVNALKSYISTQMLTGAGSGPLGGATGSEIQNGAELYRYLLANVFGGNKIAAAGATASIWGESGWNPFAQGSGGRGLIGWTPVGTISNSAFSGGMATQLPAIIRFISTSGDWGVINQMKSASSVAEAAWEWGRGVERFGIPDVHPEGIALATSFMNSGGATQPAQTTANVIGRVSRSKPHSAGGKVSEPVFGIGAYSGMPYSFAENGEPEYVGPLSGNGTGQPQMQPMTATQGQTLIAQNDQLIKLWQQFPQALGMAMSRGGGNGVRHGFYGAQG